MLAQCLIATGMGQLRAAARAGTPRHVAEGTEALPAAYSTDAEHDDAMQLLAMQTLCQPSEEQEEEAAWALSQHLTAQHDIHVVSCSPPVHAADGFSWQTGTLSGAVSQLRPQGGALGLNEPQDGAVCLSQPQPIAEGRESIAAFHPSWHLRATHQDPLENPPDTTTTTENNADSDLLDHFWRPAGVANGIAAQRQPSIAAKAGCSNFSSHVVSMQQMPRKQPPGSSRQSRQHNPIDDIVLSSEESEGGEAEDAGYADYKSQGEAEMQEDSHGQLNQRTGMVQSSENALIGTVREGRIGQHTDEADYR